MKFHNLEINKLGLMLAVLVSFSASTWAQDRKYAPLSEYLMPEDAEVALARSAAPENVSARATVKVLTPKGFKVAVQGSNGFTCLVQRSWSGAPDPKTVYYAKLRAPICFDPVASRTVLPMEELKTQLGLEGKGPEAIAQEAAAAYGLGKLPKMEGVAFAYMWSANQDVGPGFGAWHPHMMVYAPYYENSMLGGNEVGGIAPFVGEPTKSPFNVVVIRVDDKLAVKARGNTTATDLNK
jgi:hypothetical protein